MEDAFNRAIAFTLKAEGGLADDSNDPGGLTNLGVTQPPYDEYRHLQGKPPQSVRYITKNEAVDLYRLLYWNRSGSPQMPQALAIAHFDTAVNSGTGGAVMILQRCIGSTVDGAFGPNTLAGLQQSLTNSGEQAVLDTYLQRREQAYYNDVNAQSFLQGWLNRLSALRSYLAELPQPAGVAVPQHNLIKVPAGVGASAISQTQEVLTSQIKAPSQFLKGGRVDLKITHDTWLKQSTAQANTLPSDQKLLVQAGTVLTVLVWRQTEANHIVITLDGTTLNGRNTWTVWLGHTAMRFPQPEVHRVITFKDKPQSAQPISIVGRGVVDLNDPVVPGATPNILWYEVTHGGERLPPNHQIREGMERIARLAQQARDEVIQKPLMFTSGYRPPAINASVGGAKDSRHLSGDALDFYVDGLSGSQLYQMLDSWLGGRGGLGKYRNQPDICHLDARGSNARWYNN